MARKPKFKGAETIKITRPETRGRQSQTMRLINPRRMLFLPLPMWLFRMRGISWTAKVLYGRLSLYANDKGEAWPAQSTLADEFGMSEVGIRKLVKQLKDAELILVKKRGLGRTVVYLFLEHPAMFDKDWAEIDDDQIPDPKDDPDVGEKAEA